MMTHSLQYNLLLVLQECRHNRATLHYAEWAPVSKTLSGSEAKSIVYVS
jgi:hypothetical protein